MSGQACGCIEQPCGCCEAVQQLTPASECNRPGLGAISYRVGTHGQFMSSMKARLSTMEVDVASADGQTTTTLRPLRDLKTRDPNDFSIALLDGWATVGDVLSFYQERTANEGYLRTATERRSVLEMANLVGYTLRPGVAATAYLAYTIDDKQMTPTTVLKGARSQSIPGPGELPQSFETSDDLEARAGWNVLKPRMTRAQTSTTIGGSKGGPRIYLRGINTNIKVNDPLLIDYGHGAQPTPYRVLEVMPEPLFSRTLVTLSNWPRASDLVPKAAPPQTAASAPAESVSPEKSVASNFRNSVAANAIMVDPAVGLIDRLVTPPSIPPRNTLVLTRDLKSAFTQKADIGAQIVTAFQPILHGTFDSAMANQSATPGNPIRLYALRARAAVFGHTAPFKVVTVSSQGTVSVTTSEWKYPDMQSGHGTSPGANEAPDTINLDASYDKILPGSWLVIDTTQVDWGNQNFIERPTGDNELIIAKASVVNAGVARAAYGIAGKTTQIGLADRSGKRIDWFKWIQKLQSPGTETQANDIQDNSFQLIRRTAVYAQSEELSLAEEPIDEAVCDGKDTWIELDGYYSDLKSGRWVIVSGDRADITAADPRKPSKQLVVPGVQGSELLMLSSVIQDVALRTGIPAGDKRNKALPSETLHTFIKFKEALKYCYIRDKVTIYGNVVKATHGETRNETLGNGDGSKELQSFTLKQPPLTFVAAPTEVGADSTLHAYVNDVEWHETDSLAWLGPKDHGFATSTDDAGHTTLIFGDGDHGARLPTGQLNVTAKYRNGIGRAGNVRAEQISLLQTRPLGVKGVINPQRASGGADKESRDLARENAPLSVMPLDRLVSVPDYADFTRRFAGIAKAVAQKTNDGHRELVYLTIAGVDDVPIDKSSDLYLNLVDALQLQGDSDLPLRVDMRELKMLVLSAKIKILPDFIWEKVVVAMRDQLLATFGFDQRALGQPVLVSEVIACMQNFRGVAYVEVDAFGSVTEQTYDATIRARHPSTPNDITNQVRIVASSAPQDVVAWRGGRDPSQGNLAHPAELAIFTPAVPDTLILNQKS